MQGNGNIVVCDNGTGVVKAGFAGEHSPSSTFPSILGKPIIRAEDESIGDLKLKELMIGDECLPAIRHLDVSYPVDNGIIKNWNDMEQLWRYTFHNKLGISLDNSGKLEPKDMRIMLTEAPMNPKQNRQKMAEILFEKFDFSGIHCKTQAILALYSSGRTSGLVVDSGDGVTHCIGIYEGYILDGVTSRLNIAGRHITRHFLDLLQSKGYSFNSSSDFELMRSLKEQYCYVSNNYEKEVQLANETTYVNKEYELPDGRILKMDSERFEAPEILFQPSLIGMEVPGVSNMVFNAIQHSPVDVRSMLYNGIVLSGGTTVLSGFTSRLESDLKRLYKEQITKGNKGEHRAKITVSAPPSRKHAVFCGASIFASMISAMPDNWITKSEWEEQGEASLAKIF